MLALPQRYPAYKQKGPASLQALDRFGCGGLQPDPSTGEGASAPTRPVARMPAHMREREDYDLVRFDLIDEGKREAIQYRDPAIRPIPPLGRRAGKLEDRFENGVDLAF